MQRIVFAYLLDLAQKNGIMVFESDSNDVLFEFSIVGCGRNRGAIGADGQLARYTHDNPMNQDMFNHLAIILDIAKDVHLISEDLVCKRLHSTN